MRHASFDGDRAALLRASSIPATLLGSVLAASGAIIGAVGLGFGTALGIAGLAVAMIGAILRSIAGPDLGSAWRVSAPGDAACAALTILAVLCVAPITAALG